MEMILGLLIPALSGAVDGLGVVSILGSMGMDAASRRGSGCSGI